MDKQATPFDAMFEEPPEYSSRPASLSDPPSTTKTGGAPPAHPGNMESERRLFGEVFQRLKRIW
jgi:hypothetical protein